VLVDTGKPSCVLTGPWLLPDGVLKYYYVTVTENAGGSGIKVITPTRLQNMIIPYSTPNPVPNDPWALGVASNFPLGTGQVIIRADKINTLSGAIAFTGSDWAGNTFSCDPVDLTVNRETGQPATATVTGIPRAESKIVITNGDPGLTNLRIEINGWQFQVAGLKAGEVRELDVAAMMAGDDNTISFTGLGKPGDSAWVLIHD